MARTGVVSSKPPSTIRSVLRYSEIFLRRASNVGFADAEIIDGRFRGVPFLAVAPPADLGAGSLLRWALPHFYFHLVTAYDILRSRGVDIGKRDYMTGIGPLIRPKG